MDEKTKALILEMASVIENETRNKCCVGDRVDPQQQKAFDAGADLVKRARIHVLKYELWG